MATPQPSTTAGVHFKIAAHGANPLEANFAQDSTNILAKSWGAAACNSGIMEAKFSEMLQSSFPSDSTHFENVIPNPNGFVNALATAYNQHHDLVIRPDDVWITILSQFSFYVNANAEQLRSHFVAHKGQIELVVSASGNRYTADFGRLAHAMTSEIDKNVVDPTLKDWILPAFSTTTLNDTVVSSVLMMATLKTYFKYQFDMICGIPSVTILGTKADWEDILCRIDRLASFGDEPGQWALRLRLIMQRFIGAFDGERDVEFWQHICDKSGGGCFALPRYSGWITAFCWWDTQGKRLGQNSGWVLDGVSFATIDIGEVPAGIAEVDVKLVDNWESFECMMVAGHVAYQAIGERKEGIRPLPGWFMFIKSDRVETPVEPTAYELPIMPRQKKVTSARRYHPLDGIPTDQ